jgi:flavin-dependent dehydrogenase
MYDIVIIGCGPSGAHCAKQLSKNNSLKILVLDRRPMDPSSKIIKSCGGLISSHAQDALRKAGMVLPESIKVDPQFHYVKTYDFKYNLLRGYRRDYINIDRPLFEQWLIDKIPDHVERRFNTQVLAIKKPHRISVSNSNPTKH